MRCCVISGAFGNCSLRLITLLMIFSSAIPCVRDRRQPHSAWPCNVRISCATSTRTPPPAAATWPGRRSPATAPPPPVGAPPLSDQGSQVYYGEGSAASGFVIAKSKQEELDYEGSNNQEVSGHYTGSGGVPAGNLLNRLIGVGLGLALLNWIGPWLVTIEPDAARAYADAHRPVTPPPGPLQPTPTPSGPGNQTPTPTPTRIHGLIVSTPRPRSYHGTADVPAPTAKMRLVQLAEEVINLLCSDPNASVKVTVEISADFPEGASDQTKRAVTENANNLGFKISSWD